MTNLIILALCLLVLLAYLFDITSKYSKIPQVILLIGLGIVIQVIVNNTGFKMPNFKQILPIIGTLGLVLIVMEASLDLRLEKNRKKLIFQSISSAVILFVIFVAILTFISVNFLGNSVINSLLNVIPIGIISSAVAIPSTINLNQEQKEFIVYESSISDVVGILAFDFILINQDSIGKGLVNFGFGAIFTVIIAIVTTFLLALLLNKTRYHINYVIIMTSVVLVYIVAKISHLPALFLVLVFGLALSNNRFGEQTVVNKYLDFAKFRNDVDSFKKVLSELTFLIRSFFFIIFGYYIRIEGLLNLDNVFAGIVLTAGIFLLRLVFFKRVLKVPGSPLILFAPRGLITILLFLSIPSISRIPLINEEVITMIILMTIVLMMIGNLFSVNSIKNSDKIEKKISQ